MCLFEGYLKEITMDSDHTMKTRHTVRNASSQHTAHSERAVFNILSIILSYRPISNLYSS